MKPNRPKVERALALYAEGGTLRRALDAERLSSSLFYRTIEQCPDLHEQYRFIQRSRADMNVDEAYGVLESVENPQIARVKVDGLTRLAGLYDRQRYGERIQVDQTISGSIDLVAARTRSQLPRPGRDLANAIDIEVIESQALPAPRPTDLTSVEQAPTPRAGGIFDD